MNKSTLNKFMLDELLWTRAKRAARKQPLYDKETVQIIAWGYLALTAILVLLSLSFSAAAMGLFNF